MVERPSWEWEAVCSSHTIPKIYVKKKKYKTF